MAAAGASGVRRDCLNVARVLRLSPITNLTRIVFPASVPMIMAEMRISIGVAWFVIVAAEMIGVGDRFRLCGLSREIASVLVAQTVSSGSLTGQSLTNDGIR
ncbi:ABC transporter permease subunit [Bosea psychrotolerans]|uniref:ABC transporter permease subunit n=1 Tax=Bosea psychrotolerans TaxID=1871628 RepID=UPI000CDB7668